MGAQARLGFPWLSVGYKTISHKLHVAQYLFQKVVVFSSPEPKAHG